MNARLRSTALAATPRAPWRWAVLGALAGLALALALFAPAAWMAQLVQWGTQDHVQLSEARGTVWDGDAALVLTGGSGSRDSARLPGRVQWRLRPNLQGAAVQWQADCCTTTPQQMQLALGWRRAMLTVADGQSNWPATLLAGLGTPWNTVQAEGQLTLSTQGLSVEWADGRPQMAGRAELAALQVSSRLSTLKPMGSYRFTITGGPVAVLQLDTLEGSGLQLTGSGQWVGSRLRFQGEASAAPEREEALSNLLNIIGRRQGSRSIISLG